MACDQFQDGRLVCCKAVVGVLIPSLREREQYCRVDANYRRCPTWQQARSHARPLAQSEYYDLWTAPRLPPLIPRAPQLRQEPGSDRPNVTVVHTRAADDVQPDAIALTAG